MDRRYACRKRVVLTRSEEDIERDRKIFESYGFKTVPLPLIRIEPIEFELPIEKPDLIVFQSRKAVKFFLERCDLPGGTKVIAVGEKTKKALECRGVRVDLVPEDHSAEGILKALPEGWGKIVLVPRSEQGRTELLKGLPKKGYRVLPVNVYRTLPVSYSEADILRTLNEGGFIVFASPSAVKGLLANLPSEAAISALNRFVVVAIGKTTKNALERFGIHPCIIPSKPLMEKVAAEVHRFWQENCS